MRFGPLCVNVCAPVFMFLHEQDMLSKLRACSFQDGEEVSCFNELSYDMYIIRQGKAKLSMQDIDNREVISLK